MFLVLVQICHPQYKKPVRLADVAYSQQIATRDLTFLGGAKCARQVLQLLSWPSLPLQHQVQRERERLIARPASAFCQ